MCVCARGVIALSSLVYCFQRMERISTIIFILLLSLFNEINVFFPFISSKVNMCLEISGFLEQERRTLVKYLFHPFLG